MIDWPKLLTQHGIEWVDSGKSTAKGLIIFIESAIVDE